MLSRQEGIVGDIFSGAMRGGQVDEAALQQRLTAVGSDEGQLEQLRYRNPQMAAIAQRLATGTEEQRRVAMGQLRQQASGFGERETSLRARYREQGMRGRWQHGRGLMSSLADVLGGEESYAARHMGGGTRADRDAARQTGDVNQMEQEAQGSGMGGAADALLEASENMNRAAQALSGAAGTGVMDRLLSDNPVAQ
jgi:hypothetical protein